MAAKSEQPPERALHDGVDALERRAPTIDTLPPTPLAALLASGGASLVVLSTDADLMATVQRAAGTLYPVAEVATWDALEAAITAGQCGIALLDADALGERLLSRIAYLERYSSRLVLLVAADRSAAQGLMSLLAENKLHRLLIKPPAPGITRLLIESAVNRYLRLRAAAAEPVIEPLPRPAHAARARGNTRMPVWVLATAAAALLGGVVLVAAISPRWSSENVAAASARAEPVMSALSVAAQPDALAGLLAQADRALREGRLAEPPGDNALDYSLAVLGAEPAHEEGRALLGAVLNALFATAEAALLADSTEAAASALAHVRRADPTSSRLAFLEAQLERARAPSVPAVAVANAAAPERTREELASELVTSARAALASADVDAAAVIVAEAERFGADAATVASLQRELVATRTRQRNAGWLAEAETRMAAGSLFAPANDSAYDYLVRVRDSAPRTDGLDAGWAKLRAAAAAQASAAIAARDWGGAGALLDRLETVPEGDAVAEGLRAELEREQLQESYLAQASPASELTVIEQGSLVYPEDAAQRGVEGWVDLEFVVDTAGRPTRLSVVASEPEGRFEEAALAAVREYRYEPFRRNDHVFERLIRQRIRFTLR